MQRPSREGDGDQSVFSYVVLRSGRIILWWCAAEYMIHVMYMHTIQSTETYLEILPPWALGMCLYCVVESHCFLGNAESQNPLPPQELFGSRSLLDMLIADSLIALNS